MPASDVFPLVQWNKQIITDVGQPPSTDWHTSITRAHAGVMQCIPHCVDDQLLGDSTLAKM